MTRADKPRVRNPYPPVQESPRTPHGASSGRCAVWPLPRNMQVRAISRAECRRLREPRASYVRHRHSHASSARSAIDALTAGYALAGRAAGTARVAAFICRSAAESRSHRRSPLTGKRQIRGRGEATGVTGVRRISKRSATAWATRHRPPPLECTLSHSGSCGTWAVAARGS
ncbi:hypothetical protein SAFG77S_01149 [Streptomyces afghaniensis]